MAQRAAVEARDRADQEAQRARNASAVAEGRFELAKAAVDQYLNRVAASTKLKQADLVNLRRELLEAAIPFYEKLTAEKPGDDNQKAQRADAYGRLGSLRALMGDHAPARDDYEQMLEIYQQLIRDAPEHVDYLEGLAVAKNNLALRWKELGDPQRARKFFEEAAETWRTLADNDPLDEELRRHFRHQLAKSQSNLGDLLREIGARPAARHMLEKSLATRRELVRGSPDVPKYRADLVASLVNLVLFLKDFDSEAALQTLDEAIRIQQELCDELPGEPEYRAALCVCLNNHANLLRRAGRHDEARKDYERLLRIRRQLAREFSGVPRYRARLATSYNNLGQLLRETGQRDDARKAFDQARTIQQQLMEEFPDVPEHRFDIALTRANLATVLRELGHDDQSRSALEEAIAGLERLSQSDPEVRSYRFELAGDCLACADLFASAGEFDAARGLLERARKHYEKLASSAPAVIAYRHGIAASWNALGNVLGEMGQREAASAAREKAVDLFEQLVAQSPRNTDLVFALASVLASTSNLHDDQERKERHAARAVGLLRELTEKGFDRRVLIERIKVSQPLSSLRSRDDFQQLLKELENPRAGASPKPGPG